MGGIVSAVLDPFTGASKTRAAAQQAAEQQREAAQNAAVAAAFRPIGMTTRFGTSEFTRGIDPETGMPFIESAGYTPAGDIAAIRDRLVATTPALISQAEGIAGQLSPLSLASAGLFNLGSQYLAQSPEEAAQRFVASQQRLLAPQREQQLSGIRNRLFQTGRQGLVTGGSTETGMAASNPELQAYYNAMAQQDAQIAAQAEQAGQQRALFGAGLFGTGSGLLGTMSQLQAGALAPAQAQIGFASQLENLAQQPLQLGLQIGTAAQPGQQAGAQLYNQGYQQAANTMYQGTQQANALNSQFLSSLIGSAAMGFGGGGAAAGGAGGGLFGGGTQGFGQYARNLFNFTPEAGMRSTVAGLQANNIL